MALPGQPDSEISVRGSQEIYRINQALQGPGDIFELDSSAHAVFVGPNSDINEIDLTYAALQFPNLQATATISPGGPFVGRTDVNKSARYPVGNQLQRMFAAPADFVDPAYQRPAVSPAVPSRRFNLPVMIDLICALKPLPQLPSVRADRTFRLPQVPFDNSGTLPEDGSTDIVIPVYGRHLVSVQIIIPAFVGIFAQFFLATLVSGATPDPLFLGQLTVPAASVPITRAAVIRASNDLFEYDQGPATVNTITPTPLVGPMGQSDLLIINIAPNFGAPPPGTSFVDLFVRVSDRET